MSTVMNACMTCYIYCCQVILWNGVIIFMACGMGYTIITESAGGRGGGGYEHDVKISKSEQQLLRAKSV